MYNNSLFPQNISLLSIDQAVLKIKQEIESAIQNGWTKRDGVHLTDGCEAKNALIRTQMPINFLHDAVKSSFISNGVNPNYIKPSLYEHRGEITVYGALKTKDQDICIFPKDINENQETLNTPGLLLGEVDPLGYNLTESVLSINVRSQLSSSAKNFDTLYERTFAEPLNIHLRCPKMVLGDVYMITVYEYNDAAAKRNTVAFKNNASAKNMIKKYINAFDALNNRTNINGDYWKYERVCLLIVDFSRSTPVIYNSDSELVSAGLMDANANYSINNLNFDSFTRYLLDVYSQRFGMGHFI